MQDIKSFGTITKQPTNIQCGSEWPSYECSHDLNPGLVWYFNGWNKSSFQLLFFQLPFKIWTYIWPEFKEWLWFRTLLELSLSHDHWKIPVSGFWVPCVLIITVLHKYECCTQKVCYSGHWSVQLTSLFTKLA